MSIRLRVTPLEGKTAPYFWQRAQHDHIARVDMTATPLTVKTAGVVRPAARRGHLPPREIPPEAGREHPPYSDGDMTGDPRHARDELVGILHHGAGGEGDDQE